MLFTNNHGNNAMADFRLLHAPLGQGWCSHLCPHGQSWLRRGAGIAFTVGLAIAVASCGGSVPETTEATAPSEPGVATTANPPEAELALHLSQSGAVMYGAYWCPHCNDQKALFGDAVALVPYVECDPEGENAQPDRCQAENIQGYPTWIIDGQAYPGVRSLAELADYSDYTGALPQN